jgi:hypothetical protein
MSSRRTPAKVSGTDPAVILDLGTYGAQRPAFRRPRLRTAAHQADSQDHEGRKFPQIRGPELGFRRVELTCQHPNPSPVMADGPEIMIRAVRERGVEAARGPS